MPTYEYECKECGGKFELFQSMKDDALTVCPQASCLRESWGKGEVKRLLGTGAGLIFKGSGFYSTDYRSDSYKEAAKKETEKPKADKSSDKPKSSLSTPTKTKD